MSKMPRQYIYLIGLSLFLFIFVMIFSFAVLIPKGKEYRINRVELKKSSKELYAYQNFYDETLATLKNLQAKNRLIIQAFDATFDAKRFEKQNKNYFNALSISKIEFDKLENEFAVYEVNTSSQINSPSSFYNFLEAINKSDWIIGVNFPIHFKRNEKMIESSFTMKVYSNNKDKNSSASESFAK